MVLMPEGTGRQEAPFGFPWRCQGRRACLARWGQEGPGQVLSEPSLGRLHRLNGPV